MGSVLSHALASAFSFLALVLFIVGVDHYISGRTDFFDDVPVSERVSSVVIIMIFMMGTGALYGWLVI